MSITAPEGFVASGISCGIKGGGALDLALLATADGLPVPTAATFTTNAAAAAPVQVSREHLARSEGRMSAVVVSSGNANAATGSDGHADAEQMCRLAGMSLGAPSEQVLVCSTGLIGVRLPMAAVETGIPDLVARRSGSIDSAEAAATGILTTDSGPKEHLVDHGRFRVAGMAKGAGMLAPDMATMLAFLTTDAALEPDPLADLLRTAVGSTFNSMTVDGCTSTNDTVVLMASGRSGPAEIGDVLAAVTETCAVLVRSMLADAEGASRLMRVRVSGARSDGEAHLAAKKVADSLLVKCSLNGADPYWGRVASDLGSAGVEFDMECLSISYGPTAVCRAGVAAAHDGTAVAEHLAGPLVEINCDLGIGTGTGVVMGVDLGPGYIEENRTTS